MHIGTIAMSLVDFFTGHFSLVLNCLHPILFTALEIKSPDKSRNLDYYYQIFKCLNDQVKPVSGT